MTLRSKMPKQYIYASPMYRVGKLNEVYTKEDLKTMNDDYTSLVANNEIGIFTKYITDCVILKATVGGKVLSFSTLPAACSITHDSKGLLNKEEPGPIPEIYMEQILRRLEKIFPDTEIIIADGKMYLRW
jgi:hypothetical protein